MRRVLGSLFGGLARLRLAAYRRGVLHRHRLRGRVVSVGNLSVGGSGKTPVVRWLAEMLRDSGHRVAILSRGYGGTFRGDALVVSDGETVGVEATVAGDEPGSNSITISPQEVDRVAVTWSSGPIPTSSGCANVTGSTGSGVSAPQAVGCSRNAS